MNASGSHPALELQDVLEIVFTFVDKRQLSASARVCKTWKEPALNGLWRDLPSIFPLLELLGPLAYVDAGWTFQDGLEHPDWDKWLSYASRILHLTIDDTKKRDFEDSVINPEVSIHLRSSFSKWGGLYLIPKIQQLTLCYTDPSTALLALLFSDPPLKVLHLRLLKSQAPSVFTATRKILMTLTAMHGTVKLQEIAFQCWGDRGHAAEFDSSLVNFISSQPTISRLKLALTITGTSLKVILDSIPQLDTLFLGFPLVTLEDGSGHLDVVSSLVSRSQSKVEHLIYYRALPPGSLRQSRAPMARSLLDCSSLKTLTLSCVDLTRLDHATVKDMGQAWRQMEILKLLPILPTDHVHGISPAVLQQFAAFFAPSLRHLAIPIAFEPGSSLKPPTSTTKFPSLQILEVGHSIIPKDRVHQFVEFLSAITPDGTTLVHSHASASEQGQNWRELDGLFQMAQRIKERTLSELRLGMESRGA